MNTILVVEDDEGIQAIIRVYLENQGFKVVTALNGEEGLAKFRGENPDLILLDLMLPKLDGLSVCREVRKTKSTPIIILSARSGGAEKAGLEAGANDYMSKPFSPRELVDRVKRFLNLTA